MSVGVHTRVPMGTFESMTAFGTLCGAARQAARGKPMAPATAWFLLELESEVLRLQEELHAGTYRPRPYHTFEIREPKPRTISAAAFRDRVVHHALCDVLEPALEAVAFDHSYACRKGKGVHMAVDYAQQLCGAWPYVLKLDIEHFFETMDHGVLLAALADVVEDPRVLDVARRFIDAGAPGSPVGRGQPIGNLTSQHFANFYLARADHHIVEDLGVGGYVRYMDDMLVFGADRESLWRVHAHLDAYFPGTLGVALKSRATRLLPVSEGVPFLGFRIWPELRRLDHARVARYRKRMRALTALVASGAISDEEAVCSAASLTGWVSHASTLALRHTLRHR